MVYSLITKIVGTANERQLKRIRPLIQQINALEEQTQSLSDEALAARTNEFKQQLENGAREDEILPMAFATVREAAKRILGERHYDVQLMGGIVMHQGKIAEMRTGEGKTLTSTLPVYLNALSGKGAHVVTVNEYLATRDAEWMGQIYRFLGMEATSITNAMEGPERQKAYQADITYVTNNELGWDYLRDNLRYKQDHICLRPFHFAIVDEVDSILIDEARTPLIISGPAQDSSDLYIGIDKMMSIIEADYDLEIDEKTRTVSLTDRGMAKIEDALVGNGMMDKNDHLYSAQNIGLVHHINCALRAHFIFRRDRDYIVQNGKIIIIDEFTGRMMPGKRYGDGQHQAIEAKEGVSIQAENQTLASITYQNLFKLYPKLAGMTGTAMTEADEFHEIYGIGCVEIPTNVPVARIDHDDAVFRTLSEKNDAIAATVKEVQAKGQPVLVGTTSIENSELLSKLFKKEKIPHEVLNARQHEREAEIVALAGRVGAVTIATNMAGRGTDIKLGGNTEILLQKELKGDETQEQIVELRKTIKAQVLQEREKVRELGGLFVVGSERHESRRIDNQLRGRSGRQGDPGASKFFISLEDYLMSVFGAQQRIGPLLDRLNLKHGHAIVHPWINTAMERAQKKVEAMHFDNRKQLLKRDDVLNEQRLVVYEQRREVMASEDVSAIISDMRDNAVTSAVLKHIPKGSYADDWNIDGLQSDIKRLTNLTLPISEWAQEDGIGEDEIIERVLEAATSDHKTREESVGTELMRKQEKYALLVTLDHLWREHLLNMEYVRRGIGFRAVAQRDPINEYKSEAFLMYQELQETLHDTVTTATSRISRESLQALADEQAAEEKERTALMEKLKAENPDPEDDNSDNTAGNRLMPRGQNAGPELQPFVKIAVNPDDPSTWTSVPRNSSCPCGSGKKYKHCHGKVA